VVELAHHMALVPVLWLAGLHLSGQRRDPAWWWLAGAYGVSWLADAAAIVVDPWLVSAVYPVTQASLVAAVLAPRRHAVGIVGLLVLIGVLAIMGRGTHGPDVLLHTVAYGTVVALVTPLPLGRLRVALLAGFGGMGVAWLAFAAAPSWPTWGAFQAMRALGLGLFCWAGWKPQPRLRLA
jgi:hypothetical protein